MASGNPRRTPARLCAAIDAAAVAHALALVHEFAAAHGLSAAAAGRLAIVVEELVANLVDHARLPAAARLELVLVPAGDRVQLVLTDPATPFDPRLATPAAIPVRGGNAGLALVRAFARFENYDRVAGRNVLRLSVVVGPPF